MTEGFDIEYRLYRLKKIRTVFTDGTYFRLSLAEVKNMMQQTPICISVLVPFLSIMDF